MTTRTQRMLQGTVVVLSLVIWHLMISHIYGYDHIVETSVLKMTNMEPIGDQTGPLTNRSPANFADLTMEERKQFVARRCSEIKNQEMARKKKYMYTKPYYNMLFDKKHNLIACNNHKVGSSTIVAVLYNISDHQNVSSDSFRKEHLRQRLIPESINNSSAKAFMFVREPLQRLLSAYGNKGGLRKIRKVSFARFLENVLKEIDANHRVNSHHMSYFQRCRPCDVEYDYVGTMETFDKDLKYILGQFGIDIDIVPRQNNEGSSSDGEDTIKNVPMDIKRQIWESYKEDYVLFGYPNFIQTNDSLV